MVILSKYTSLDLPHNAVQSVAQFKLHIHTLCYETSDIMDYFLAGEDQQQTNQPNDLAGG